jgi:hypothetical protein
MSTQRRPLASVAATAGAVDTALFIATRPSLFKTRPGRASANLGVLAAWTALAVVGRSGARRTSLALAGTLAAANAAMLAGHLSHGVLAPRVFIGPALSAVALAELVRPA